MDDLYGDYVKNMEKNSEYDFFIESSGDLAAANQLSVDLTMTIKHLARFAAIRDPTKYIIIPMLRPHLVAQIAPCKIYEFADKFYFGNSYLSTCFGIMDNITGDTLSNYDHSVHAQRLQPNRIWNMRDNGWVFAHTRPLALLHMR